MYFDEVKNLAVLIPSPSSADALPVMDTEWLAVRHVFWRGAPK